MITFNPNPIVSRTRIIILFWIFSLFVFPSCKSAIVLTSCGRSEYRIVIPEMPSQPEIKAARELQAYLHEISGVVMPIVPDTGHMMQYEILLGNNRHLSVTGFNVDINSLEEDGFIIKTIGDKLIIAGGNDKGTLYGVYTFLEKFLGCRYYSSDARMIPEQENIVLDRINEKQVPLIRFREMYFPACLDSTYLEWHKLDRHDDGSWGIWVHTFDDLVPAAEYFTWHPEYFSEIGGDRIPDGQLCLSNNDLLQILVSNLKKKTDAKPGAIFWSVSQNDNYLECQCSACRELNKKFGGSSGTMTDFVNHVAEELPDKVISTLAYQYTRAAPENIRPAENVNIMLCTIECNRSLPIAEDPGSASFTYDIANWGKLTDNIILWDYVVQFRNLISPFPNLRVLQPNLQFFVDNNCTMMFQQGSGSLYSEFAELRAYLIAKLLWDPDADVDEIMDDFLLGYYGAAGSCIRRYIDIMHDALEESGNNLWIYGYPYDAVDSYLTQDLIRQYEGIFDQATAAVITDPVLSKRVRMARLPLEFAILDISLHEPWPEMSYFNLLNGQRQVRKDMVQRLEDFVTGCAEAGIQNLEEQGTSPAEYQNWVLEMLDIHR